MFRESSELSLTRQPAGKLPTWVNTIIALACAVSFASVAVGSSKLWAQLPSWVDLGYFRYGLTFFITFWILVSLLPPWPMSRAIRVAVLLPIAHAIMVASAWPVWNAVSSFMLDADAVTSFARHFPLALAVGGTAVVFAGVAAVLARRRSGEWIQGFAMLSLAELLLLGLWIPIVCGMRSTSDWWSSDQPLVNNIARELAYLVMPPTLAAIGFTAVALRRPAALVSWHWLIACVVPFLAFLAFVLRADAGARELLLYSNFLPLLLTAALVATLGLAVLGGVTWWRSWRMHRALGARDRRAGVIIADSDEPAFGLEITSWLRGPRVVQRPFNVTTSTGVVPVRGAHLVGAMPAATTQLRVGECLGVLRGGDEVVVGGIADDTGGPFRASAAPIADELYVAPAAADGASFASVALVMWRPCVAYLLIVSTIAVPALAALLTS